MCAKFDTKWLRGGASSDEPLVGSADIQSLSDMANTFDDANRTDYEGRHPSPASRDSRADCAAGANLMPLGELLKMLFGMLF